MTEREGRGRLRADGVRRFMEAGSGRGAPP